uniref:Protein E6 n=1 Tax=Human papillomavirus type 61 TaxID=37116 RepID=A0A0P0EGB0_HPV61|nr:early protein E6 [Human papillomavirus type 61]ALJ32784.1 early protein E6 [Human papillomavirus type 61]
MGPCNPTNIFLLCKDYEVDFEDLRLTCVFCKNELTTEELLVFALKELCIVWRHNWPFGVCAPCLAREVKVRELRHWDHSCYGPTVEQTTGRSLAELYIRCHACCKPLSIQEKEHQVQAYIHFHYIAGQWTGRCCQCRGPCTARWQP